MHLNSTRTGVFFGRGQWTGVRGHVTVPRKNLIC